jgi:regulator of RNase E activity RraA
MTEHRAADTTTVPAEESSLCEHIERSLYTAVVADSLDQLGYREQAMREYLRPVHDAHCFAGRARTVAWTDVFHTADNPYELEIEAVDSILPGEVVIISTQRSQRNAPWGELLSTAATARKARGAVIDGLIRDVKKIEEIGFPVFAAGIKPVDSKGRGIVTEYNVPVECGGVTVHPGDLVFADYDGVVVIPSGAVREAVELATKKVGLENKARADLQRGEYLRDVYKRYGVL